MLLWSREFTLLRAKMDKIDLAGLRYYGYTGYLPEEKTLGQWFEVDLTLWLDLAIAGNSDRLEDTLDYRQAIDIVRDKIETNKGDTIENLAMQMLRSLLELNPIEQVRIRLTKVAAPIPGFNGKVSVEFTRSRGDSL